jgi:hypothetical protein
MGLLLVPERRRSTGVVDTTTPERNATVSGLNGLNGLTWEDKAVRIGKLRNRGRSLRVHSEEGCNGCDGRNGSP